MFVFRSAETSDAGQIADFNCRLARETEDKELDPQTVQQGVLRGLGLAPEVRYFVVEAGSSIIGQLMLTREWSDWRNGWMVWLQSVYVVAEWRGQGVFRKLFSYAIEVAAADADVVNVRLYVEHANHTAMATYRSLGFASAGYQVMEKPLDTSK